MLDGFLTVMLGEEDINIQNDAIYTSKLEGRIEGLAEGEAKGKAEGLAEGMGQVASRKDRHRLPNRCLPFSCYPIGFSRTSYRLYFLAYTRYFIGQESIRSPYMTKLKTGFTVTC